MQNAVLRIPFLRPVHQTQIFLCIVWCCGILLGCLAAFGISDSFLTLMRTASLRSVSFVAATAVILLPFLLTAIAVFIKSYLLVLGVAFLKAFCWSYCSMLVLLAFGSSGWLIRLFLLGDWIFIPVLFGFWIYIVPQFTISSRTAVRFALTSLTSLAFYTLILLPYLRQLTF